MTTAQLSELDDPAFIDYWSRVRLELVLSGNDAPQELKDEYQEVVREYHRRIDGES